MWVCFHFTRLRSTTLWFAGLFEVSHFRQNVNIGSHKNVFDKTDIEGDSEGQVNILVSDSICHCEKNTLYERVINSNSFWRWSNLNL
jgi:hypothetical protein